MAIPGPRDEGLGHGWGLDLPRPRDGGLPLGCAVRGRDAGGPIVRMLPGTEHPHVRGEHAHPHGNAISTVEAGSLQGVEIHDPPGRNQFFSVHETPYVNHRRKAQPSHAPARVKVFSDGPAH